MRSKKSPKVNFLLSLLFSLLLFTSLNSGQEVDNSNEEHHQRFDYRRLDQNNLPPIEKYTQPKEQVFPLGYGKNNLNKITTGTGVWTELNPKVPRVMYIGLHFVNKDTGWACGQSGAVIKTMDGGSNWTISETPVNNLLLKTHSYNGQIVLVTGYDGIILRSSDAGNNFEQVTSGVGNGYDLWGVQIINDTLGFVCGLTQTLLKTIDAGLSWQPVSTGLNQHYWAVDFINEQYGMIACSGGKILKTTDGGNMWTQIQAGDTRALYTIDIIDSIHIAAAGADGKNVYSSDGGTTWITNQDLPAFTATNSIDFINADTGYTVQDVYDIRKTTNRGQTWFNPTTNVTSEWHIQLLFDGTGYSCGDDLGDALSFYKRTDGQENWIRLFLNDNFADVSFTDAITGYIAGGTSIGGPVYKTTDGGLTWFGLPNFPINLFTTTLTCLTFTDNLTGFAGGAPFRIIKTTDAGETWYMANRTGVTDTLGHITKFFFINKTIGWAITSFRGTIFKTTDGGDNWFAQLITVGGYGFSGVYFVDSLFGWVSGARPFKTTDGGQNWVQQSNTTLWNSDDVYFVNQDTGWFAKYSSINNSLFKTTDGGLNWIGISEVIGARKFYFLPDPVHWLTIGFSQYYWTNDYGNSWQEFTEDVPIGLESFSAPNDFLGYSVGNGGLILRYEDTTYVPIELISFEGRIKNKEIVLSWFTKSELNNQGFYIEKSLDVINWETIGMVNGKGSTTESNSYSFVDRIMTDLKIYYRLKQVDYDGSFTYSNILEIEVGKPTAYFLWQNHPNPFNPETSIKYDLPGTNDVSLIVYDLLGRQVKELVNSKQQAGRYEVQFDASNLASGVYIYQLIAENPSTGSGQGFIISKKMILLR